MKKYFLIIVALMILGFTQFFTVKDTEEEALSILKKEINK